MSVLLTSTDLLTDISLDELEGLTANLIEMGQADPVATAIAEALGVISMYALPWSIPDDALKRIWRLLAIAALYNRLGTIPEKRKDERAWALSVLKDIRDGKFPNLQVDTSVSADSVAGLYGSATALSFSSSATTDL